MRFAYKRYSDIYVRPVIPVRVAATDKWIDYEVLVDSGADICIFDAELAEPLGIDLESGEHAVIFSATGSVQDVYIHPVELTVGPRTFGARVAFMPTAEPYGLAGQQGLLLTVPCDVRSADGRAGASAASGLILAIARNEAPKTSIGPQRLCQAEPKTLRRSSSSSGRSSLAGPVCAVILAPRGFRATWKGSPMDLSDPAVVGGTLLTLLGIVTGLFAWIFSEAPFRRRVMIGVPCLVLSLVGVALVLRGQGGKAAASPPAPSTGRGAEVRACMAQHQMSRAVATATTLAPPRVEPPSGPVEQERVTIYQRCDWPPPAWADPDGYSEIRLQVTLGPGETEATGTDVADVIKSRCSELRLSYIHASQGFQESKPPFTSPPDRVITYYDAKDYHNQDGPVPFYHDRDELVVLRNAKAGLDDVRCVK